MPRHSRPVIGMLASLLMATLANAQESGIRWQQDIESAKAEARQTHRMVLVHVVADGCGPCRALESNVFNQPGVAAAIEQQFVPVKLNANEYPAIAQAFGITRVPTDVIVTPEGEVIGKMISPATPAAYVAETTQIVKQYASRSGQAYQLAAANAPNPATLNAAYANLPIGQTSMQTPPAAPAVAPAIAATQAPAQAGPATTYNNSYTTPPAGTVTNGYAPSNAPSYSTEQPVTPIATNPAANPYGAYAPPTQQAPAQPQPQYQAPAQNVAPAYGLPTDTSVPPATPSGPVSEEAQLPTTTQQAVTTPDARQLPAGAPPLGFDGFCPVSMRTAWKWTPGDPKFGAIHRGRTYWFAGAQEQQEFLTKPDYYSPALAGIDPVLAIDHRQSVAGLREHSLDYDGQFFLFSSEATLQQFTASPERYAQGVRQAMGMQPSQQTR